MGIRASKEAMEEDLQNEPPCDAAAPNQQPHKETPGNETESNRYADAKTEPISKTFTLWNGEAYGIIGWKTMELLATVKVRISDALEMQGGVKYWIKTSETIPRELVESQGALFVVKPSVGLAQSGVAILNGVLHNNGTPHQSMYQPELEVKYCNAGLDHRFISMSDALGTIHIYRSTRRLSHMPEEFPAKNGDSDNISNLESASSDDTIFQKQEAQLKRKSEIGSSDSSSSSSSSHSKSDGSSGYSSNDGNSTRKTNLEIEEPPPKRQRESKEKEAVEPGDNLLNIPTKAGENVIFYDAEEAHES